MTQKFVRARHKRRQVYTERTTRVEKISLKQAARDLGIPYSTLAMRVSRHGYNQYEAVLKGSDTTSPEEALAWLRRHAPLESVPKNLLEKHNASK